MEGWAAWVCLREGWTNMHGGQQRASGSHHLPGLSLLWSVNTSGYRSDGDCAVGPNKWSMDTEATMSENMLWKRNRGSLLVACTKPKKPWEPPQAEGPETSPCLGSPCRCCIHLHQPCRAFTIECWYPAALSPAGSPSALLGFLDCLRGCQASPELTVSLCSHTVP